MIEHVIRKLYYEWGEYRGGVGDGNLKDHHNGQDGTAKENNERDSLIEGPIM